MQGILELDIVSESGEKEAAPGGARRAWNLMTVMLTWGHVLTESGWCVVDCIELHGQMVSRWENKGSWLDWWDTGCDVRTQISEDQGDDEGLMQTRRLEYTEYTVNIVSHLIKYVSH